MRDIPGHEFMGIVEDAGRGVTRLKRGDRVVVPFTISCGDCSFCRRKLFAACETTNPGRGAIINKKERCPGAGLFGYSHLYGGHLHIWLRSCGSHGNEKQEDCRKVILAPSFASPEPATTFVPSSCRVLCFMLRGFTTRRPHGRNSTLTIDLMSDKLRRFAS